MNHPYFTRHKSFTPSLHEAPHSNLGIVVVIPSYNEPHLSKTLQSLVQCTQPSCSVEVIVVVNYPEGSASDVVDNAHKCIKDIAQANSVSSSLEMQILPIAAFNLVKKHAGVGLARKIGMDEAAWRLEQSSSAIKVIACFDADATCEPNYLVELETLWKQKPKTDACSIRYAHPIHGNDYNELLYKGITEYELHLRYYVQAGRFIGHPFSFQTVGSSMACSAEAYMRFGGMNKNKAGEDFYFLQKIIPHGHFEELNTTCIYPSPRPSYRVPFGTGRAMTKYLEASSSSDYLTYNLDSFLTLVKFFHEAPRNLFNASSSTISHFWSMLPEPVQAFASCEQFVRSILEVNANSSSEKSFAKRLFLHYDAFWLLKYLNFAGEHYFPKQPVSQESLRLLEMISFPVGGTSAAKLLFSYREIDAKRD